MIEQSTTACQTIIFKQSATSLESIVIILILSMSGSRLPSLKDNPNSRTKGLVAMLGHHRHRQLLINRKYEWACSSALPSEQHAIQKFVNMSLSQKRPVLKAVVSPDMLEESQPENTWPYRKVLIINHKPTHSHSGSIRIKSPPKLNPEELVKIHHRSNMSIQKLHLHKESPLRPHARSLQELGERRNRSCNVTVAKRKEDF